MNQDNGKWFDISEEKIGTIGPLPGCVSNGPAIISS